MSQGAAGITHAAFCMGRHRIFADVVTGDRRLVDILRDPNRQYLDVRKSWLAEPGDGASRREYGAGLLAKGEIEWATILSEPPRVEQRFFARVKKSPVRVALVVPSGAIEGTVHVENQATDPVQFFLRTAEKGLERFLIATDARLPNGETAEGIVIVNRAAVQHFSVLRD